MAGYVDVDLQVAIWAREIVESVDRGSDLRAEMTDVLQAAGAVFCALLEGKYPDFLAVRCDNWLTELAQELKKAGIVVPDNLINELIIQEFGQAGRSIINHQSNPAMRHRLWQEGRL